MNLFAKEKWAYRQRKQTYGHQRGKEWGKINKEVEINIYTLLCIR